MFDIEAVRSRGLNGKVQLALEVSFRPHTASFLSALFTISLRSFYLGCCLFPFHIIRAALLHVLSYRPPPSSTPTRLTHPCLVVSACHCHGWPYPSITPVAVLRDLSGHK